MQSSPALIKKLPAIIAGTPHRARRGISAEICPRWILAILAALLFDTKDLRSLDMLPVVIAKLVDRRDVIK